MKFPRVLPLKISFYIKKNKPYFIGTIEEELSSPIVDSLFQIIKNKSLIIPIQYPSLCYAEKQIKNGGRLHHHIKNKNLSPRIIKGKRDNIAWDTYKEDTPFTNEPKRKK